MWKWIIDIHTWNKEKKPIHSSHSFFISIKRKKKKTPSSIISFQSSSMHRTTTKRTYVYIHLHTYKELSTIERERERETKRKKNWYHYTNMILSSRDTLQGCVGRTTWHISYHAIISNDADKIDYWNRWIQLNWPDAT